MPSLPTSQEIKKPLLAYLKRKGETSPEDALAFIAKKFSVSKKVQKQMQKCGKESTLRNRLRWARRELAREGKVVTTRRGYFRLD